MIVAIALVIAYTSKYIFMKRNEYQSIEQNTSGDDNSLEEVGEQVIDQVTGLCIDASPKTPDPDILNCLKRKQ